MGNLPDQLIGEIQRVAEIVGTYESLPGGVGMIAATMMRADLETARKALSDFDAVAMIDSFKKLETWKE